MESGLSLQTRRALLQQVIPQYRGATTVKKSKLLDDFTAMTGYHRKYAMWLLNHANEGQQTLHRPHHYESEVQHALFLVWNAASRICAKRLIPFSIASDRGSRALSSKSCASATFFLI